jgi:hypothetical protein
MRMNSKSRLLILAATSALALAACSQGSEIASPGATNPGGGGSGGSGGGGGGSGGGATCPAGTTNAGALGSLTVCNLTGEILSNLTLPNLTNVVYRLNGRVDVGRDIGGDGALAGGTPVTLTVQPGVRIFGGAAGDLMVVNRGSRIVANGSVTQPIIFTSQAQLQGFNGLESSRQWGGVVIAGRAPIRSCATAVPAESVNCQDEVEGITASTGRPARYGGATPGDDSGSLQYVQIKFAGAFLPGAAAGDDLNGLTLAGIGSATTVDFVQIHNSGDDGAEIFGGRVNLKHLILTGIFDDSLDCDSGWTGNVQFALTIQRLYSAGGSAGPDSLVECSNAIKLATSAATVQTRPTVANFTFIGQPTNDGGSNLRGIALDSSAGSPGASGQFYNGIVIGSRRCLSVSASDNGSRGPGDFSSNTIIRSVKFDCGASGTTSPEALGLIQVSGGNNTGPTPAQSPYVASTLALAATPRVSNTVNFDTRFVNGSSETSAAAFNLATLGNPFFVNTTWIGAVRDNTDNWWRTWSCGLETTNCQ